MPCVFAAVARIWQGRIDTFGATDVPMEGIALIRMTWRRRVTTVLATAAATVLVTAGAAHAYDATVHVLDDSGHADWHDIGDELTVCDDRADGWGVRGYIYRPNPGDPGNGTVLMKVSDPQYDENYNCEGVSVNISETISISIKVCNYKGATITLCDYKAIPR
jgi:hypothetical protein